VREEWLVEDRWWTPRPLRRRYFELTTASGANRVVFCDLVAGGWFTQKLASWIEVLRWLPRLRRERAAIQATRRVTPAAFARSLTADLDSSYLGAAGRSRVLRALLRAYWSGVRALLPG